MVGNHKSGRKADPLAGQVRHKKITFYVKEYQDYEGWKLDPIFVWFKRHHGTDWQTRVRQYMYNGHCECDNIGVLGNYVHVQTPKCHRCGTWKNEHVRRIHEK